MQITIAEIVSLLGALGAILLALANRRKTNTEADKLREEITTEVLKRAKTDMDAMQTQINEVRAENRKLRAEVERYQQWTTALCSQVIDLGQVPVPMPEPMPEKK